MAGPTRAYHASLQPHALRHKYDPDIRFEAGAQEAVDDIDDINAVVAHMRSHGVELIGKMRYGDTYRLAYLRGPEGNIVGLAEQLGEGASRRE